MAKYLQVFQLALKLDEHYRYTRSFKDSCTLSRNLKVFSERDALPAFIAYYGRYERQDWVSELLPALKVSFREVPLLLTSRSPAVKLVVKWRLLVGE